MISANFVITVLGLSYFIYILLSFLFGPLFKIKERIYRIEKIYGRNIELENIRKLPFRDRVTRPLKDWVVKEVGKKTPAGLKENLEAKIERAGRPYDLTAGNWLVFKVFVSFGLPLFVLFMIAIGNNSLKDRLMPSILLVAACIVTPDLMLNAKIKRRKMELRKQLPDVLDMLTVSVESGLSFDGAISKLIEKGHGELVKEFEKAMKEVQVGKSRREALKNMAERCDVDDIKVFISSVIQAEQLGVAIGKVLRIQAAQMRTKRRQLAEEQAMKAPVKMIIPLALFILPSVFVVALGPTIIQFKNLIANWG